MNSEVIVIDGGFSTQLSKHVGPVDGDPLWSARFNYTNPNAIIRTHMDFLEAGADLILTNTYQASIEGFTEYLSITNEESIELIKSTVKLAYSKSYYLLIKSLLFILIMKIIL
jgi:homocysteine S-methyltransferase